VELASGNAPSAGMRVQMRMCMQGRWSGLQMNSQCPRAQCMAALFDGYVTSLRMRSVVDLHVTGTGMASGHTEGLP
jgi:hypothetical protein